MADSNITKRALAASLKQLMEEKPFDKINVGDICASCGMNRKSFYYHFKDKYDLVNWIFDTELIDKIKDKEHEDARGAILEISHYFYANRVFYRKAFCITGQNSFPEHFHSLLFSVIARRLRETMDEKEVPELTIKFIADAVVMSFRRWIVDNETLSPEEFVSQIELGIKYVSFRQGETK